MRILHVLRAPVGGLFRHVLDLSAEQSARGHEVGILADSNAEDQLTARKFAALAPVLKLGILRTPMSRQPGLGDVTATRTVRAHARSLHLDVLHGHGAKGGAYARLAARGLKRDGQTVTAFYTPHGGSLNFKPQSPGGRVFLGLERALERLTGGLIFESAYAQRVYRERVSSAEVPYRIVPNGLQPEDFERAIADPLAADILFIGELRALKGVNVLLEAIAALNAERSIPVRAVIVGSGPDAETFKALAHDLGLQNAVSFPGALVARSAFGLGRVMVVPSLAESFPYVVLEAAAAGLPLVSTNVGGIPEIVAGTDTVLIEPGSVAALASALRTALADPAAARARADRLREAVAAKFTVAGMTSAILDFYRTARR